MIKKFLIIFLSLLSSFLYANENLYFLGQNLNVISVISDRPELPNRSPANVIILKKSQNIFKFNSNLMEILNSLPGFYIEPIKGVDRLYFRGIKNSVLFLYDGVPITSDATKNLIPSDYTLNKNFLSKIEIVYGASSVFWGPDAFGGVVNLVPDEIERNKIQTSITIGNKNNEIFVKKGINFKNLNGTIGVSYLHRENDYTNKNLETYGKLHLLEDFNVTFHFSNYDNNYKTKYKDVYHWKSSYKFPFNLVKFEYNKNFTHTSLKIKSYFLDLKSRYKEDYFHWKQHSNTYFGEIRISRDLFNNNGLLTIGTSIKKIKTFDSDVVVRGFIPDYIINKNSFFTPLADKVSFNSNLKSLYLQYVHNIKNFEFWGGIRYDDHSEYNNMTNWNLGLGGFWNNYFFKISYATAYRTPIAEKFLSRKNIDPEKIRMFSITNNFKIKDFTLKLTTFWQKINHRIYEDNYGGFSESGKNKIYGVETLLNLKLMRSLKLWANFTGLKQTGDEEEYKILKYILIIPGNPPEYVYDYKYRNLDYGAKYFGSLGLNYKRNKWDLLINFNWHKEREYTYLEDYSKYEKNFIYSLNLGAEFKYSKKLNFILNIKNLLNNNRKIPGKYYEENLSGTSFTLNLKYLF